jgi:hypothetical protein
VKARPISEEMRMTLPGARAARLALALLQTAWLHAALAHAQTESEAEAEAPAPSAAVAPGTFPHELAPARQALAEQARMRLREAGVDVRPAWELRAKLAGRSGGPPSTCSLVEKAAADAAHVVLADLRTTLWNRRRAPRLRSKGCKLVGAARAGRATRSGPRSTRARRVLPALGGSADLLAPAALELDQLGAESRAIGSSTARARTRLARSRPTRGSRESCATASKPPPPRTTRPRSSACACAPRAASRHRTTLPRARS